MKIYNKIFEGISNTVYHYTQPKSLVSILETDTIKASQTLDDRDEDLNRGYTYFISTARNLNSNYFSNELDGVIIEIDGEKLSRNLRGGPVDYYGIQKERKKEFEDRIFLNKPTVENFKKYIKRIYFMINKNSDMQILREIKTGIELCKKIGIQYNFLVRSDLNVRKDIRGVPYSKKEIIWRISDYYNEKIYNSKKELKDVESFLELSKIKDFFPILQLLIFGTIPQKAIDDGIFSVRTNEKGRKYLECMILDRLLDGWEESLIKKAIIKTIQAKLKVYQKELSKEIIISYLKDKPFFISDEKSLSDIAAAGKKDTLVNELGTIGILALSLEKHSVEEKFFIEKKEMFIDILSNKP
jgi:hypothetical protein